MLTTRHGTKRGMLKKSIWGTWGNLCIEAGVQWGMLTTTGADVPVWEPSGSNLEDFMWFKWIIHLCCFSVFSSEDGFSLPASFERFRSDVYLKSSQKPITLLFRELFKLFVHKLGGGKTCLADCPSLTFGLLRLFCASVLHVCILSQHHLHNICYLWY